MVVEASCEFELRFYVQLYIEKSVLHLLIVGASDGWVFIFWTRK